MKDINWIVVPCYKLTGVDRAAYAWQGVDSDYRPGKPWRDRKWEFSSEFTKEGQFIPHRSNFVDQMAFARNWIICGT